MKDATKKPDVIVAGAGPCGSFAALTTAASSFRVLVLEEHEKIGVPKHCAGLLSVNGLASLGVEPPPRTVENRVYGAVIHAPSGQSFSVRRESPVSYVVDRTLFDQHIASLAMHRGVEYAFKTTVKSLLTDSSQVKGVVVERNGVKEVIGCKIVIDAEGCAFRLLKKAGLPTPNRSMLFYGAQIEVEDVEDMDEKMVEIYLGQKFAPGFFAWIIPKGNGLAKVGLATKWGNLREFLRSFIEKHPDASHKLRKTRVNGTSFHMLSLGGLVKKTYSGGLLVVGDAASHVKPTTGGGVIFGMLGARVAGRVARESLQSNNFSARFLSHYQSECRRMMGLEMRMMLAVRKAMMQMSDSKLDKLITACRQLEMSKILEEKGDMDFQGRTMLQVAKNPRALALLAGFAASFIESAFMRREK